MSNSQNVGFRVFTKVARPSAEVVEGLRQCETVHITDAMNRFGGMDDNIRPRPECSYVDRLSRYAPLRAII
jgi:hypothetical protein